jgi:hypothetical protein
MMAIVVDERIAHCDENQHPQKEKGPTFVGPVWG